jgi:hypothetical protein
VIYIYIYIYIVTHLTRWSVSAMSSYVYRLEKRFACTSICIYSMCYIYIYIIHNINALSYTIAKHRAQSFFLNQNLSPGSLGRPHARTHKAPTPTPTDTHTSTRAHTRAHAHTHTHTHTRPVSALRAGRTAGLRSLPRGRSPGYI